ncbi:MAG: TraR/DksA C4-type zinc finger protein [Desulfobacterales bacterium]
MSIEDGTFSICETCGEDISIERLQKPGPMTTQCIDCKTKGKYGEGSWAVIPA